MELGEKLEGAQAGEMRQYRGQWRDRDRPVQSLAGPSSSSSVAPAAACSALPREVPGVFRPPRSAPFATNRPQTPGSLRQAGAQAWCRAAASALGLASRTVDSCRQGCPPPAAGGGGLLSTHCVPVRRMAPRLLTTLCSYRPGRSPMAALSTDAGPLSLGPGLGGRGDKSWGSAPCLPTCCPG